MRAAQKEKEQARAVAPWTWRCALRDNPEALPSPSVLLTLLVIGTFMDRDGYAFPGQEKIAAGARTSVRSAQRHIATARRLGWLAVESAGRNGQGWRHNAYRCAVPADIELSAKHQEITDAHESQVEPLPERDDTAMSAPSSNGAKRDDNGSTKVTTNGAEGDDTGSKNVTTQPCRTNSYSETHAYITPTPKAHADASARISRRFSGRKKPEELEAEALQRAKALAASIRFREIGPDECPRQYAAAVVMAQASRVAA